jgi:hypothetical protein
MLNMLDTRRNMNTDLRTSNYDIRHTNYDIRSSGYTLAEAMLAVVIVGMAASGVLLPFASGEAVRAEGMHRTLAAKLAADKIDEIVATADYNDCSEPQGQIEDATGTMFTDADAAYANFSRAVICQEVFVPQQDETLPATFIRVTVKVYYRGREIVGISRLVSK